jgi:hypothetical protein
MTLKKAKSVGRMLKSIDWITQKKRRTQKVIDSKFRGRSHNDKLSTERNQNFGKINTQCKFDENSE